MPNYPMIQGKHPDSWAEVFFAFACDKLKIDYRYQVPLFGGSRLRGGIVVDFVVSIPFQTPVEIYGRYWHEGQLGADDRLKLAAEWQFFGREAIVIWDNELETQEKAYQAVRKHILRR